MKTAPCSMPKLCEPLPHVQSPKVVEPKKPPAAKHADKTATMKLLAEETPAASPADQTGMMRQQTMKNLAVAAMAAPLVDSLPSLPQPREYCYQQVCDGVLPNRPRELLQASGPSLAGKTPKAQS